MHIKAEKVRIFLTSVGAGLLFCLLATDGLAASPQKNIKQGNKLYEQGKFEASKEKYMEALTKNPESDIINFNLGTALYKARDYDQAMDHFQKALLSEDAKLKEKAYYNSGNTLYQMGMAQEQSAVEQAVASLEKSIAQYERALEIDKKGEDTLNNYAFVERELKRLKEKMQNQQQQQQQKSEQKKDSDGSQEQQQQQGGEQKPQQDQGQSEQQKQSQQQQQEQQQGDQQQQQNEQQQGQQQQQNSTQSSGDKNDQRQDANGQTQANAQELTQEEAQMLLETYQQTEEPQGLLNIHQKIQDNRPVTKDW